MASRRTRPLRPHPHSFWERQHGGRAPHARVEEGAPAGCLWRAAWGRAPLGCSRSSSWSLASGAPWRLTLPRGPSALGDRPGPHLALHPHLVEAVLAVGFRFHLHLHQHRVRPRHIAQHGWGRWGRYSRLLFGVRGAAASPPIRPSSGLGEADPREAAALQTPAPQLGGRRALPPPPP